MSVQDDDRHDPLAWLEGDDPQDSVNDAEAQAQAAMADDAVPADAQPVDDSRW